MFESHSFGKKVLLASRKCAKDTRSFYRLTIRGVHILMSPAVFGGADLKTYLVYDLTDDQKATSGLSSLWLLLLLLVVLLLLLLLLLLLCACTCVYVFFSDDIHQQRLLPSTISNFSLQRQTFQRHLRLQQDYQRIVKRRADIGRSGSEHHWRRSVQRTP